MSKPIPNAADFRALVKRVIELCMPDLRAYYRMPIKGRVVSTYASGGSYWADVQPLRNDETDDAAEPVLPKVELPVIWGGKQRGLVGPPAKGTIVVISFFDGDPTRPFISHALWRQNSAPSIGVGGFICQQRPGRYIKITPDGKVQVQASRIELNPNS